MALMISERASAYASGGAAGAGRMGFSTLLLFSECYISVEEYIACEEGKEDLNFAFLYKCSLNLC